MRGVFATLRHAVNNRLKRLLKSFQIVFEFISLSYYRCVFTMG